MPDPVSTGLFAWKLFDAVLGFATGKAADRLLALRSDAAARAAFDRVANRAYAGLQRRFPLLVAEYFEPGYLRGQAAAELAKFWTLTESPDPVRLADADNPALAADRGALIEAATFFLDKLRSGLLAEPALRNHVNDRLLRAPSVAAPPVAAPVADPAVRVRLPPPRRLFGRDRSVTELAGMLAKAGQAAVLLHGPPGIGKTALSVAALHAPQVIEGFGGRRHFATLESIRTGAGLLDAVAASLGLEPGPDRSSRALDLLDGERRLVVLDNLETPWEHDPSGVQEALAQLAGTQATLLASIRGTERPGGCRWTPGPALHPLDPASGRSLFMHWAQAATDDPGLDTLLAALDGLPLAIELLARRYGDAGDTARLLDLWRTHRTALARVGGGGHKAVDLAASIELSLASPRLGDAGRALFAMLGPLPDGLAEADLSALLQDAAFDAASGLCHTGLAYRDGTRLRTLAPLREHARSIIEPEQRGSVARYFLSLAAALPPGGQVSALSPGIAHARLELPNIEAILELELEERPADRELAILSSNVADTRCLLGGLEVAFNGYRLAHRVMLSRAEAAPDERERQRDLSVSFNRIGDVLVAQGEGDKALESYRDGLAIAEKLVAADPRNALWQRDLSISYDKIGVLLRAQGEGDKALQSFRDSLAIRQKLAATDPRNTEWQRDVSISFNKIGDEFRARGDSAEALQSYREGLAIAQVLAAVDPHNVEWQRDLSVSFDRIGDVLRAQEEGDEALRSYGRGLAIRRKLATADPRNTQWQRDLSLSYFRLGDMLQAQGECDKALQCYGESLAIAETLASADPRNTEWLGDLSFAHIRIGDVLLAQGQGDKALQCYRRGFTIAETLAAVDPRNARWQRELAISYVKLAEAADLADDPVTAIDAYTKSLAVATALAESGRLTPVDAWIPDELQRRIVALESKKSD